MLDVTTQFATGNHGHDSRYSDIENLSSDMLVPITGFEDQPLVPLETAVEPLIMLLPEIQSCAYVAKERCKQPADGLSVDESASIMLYTMSWEPSNECLFVVLNKTLRSEDRQRLKPWFLYLKLLLTALSSLPSQHLLVYRGIKQAMNDAYQEGETVVWWGFSSCCKSIGILQSDVFLGTTGTRTIFTIDCTSGKDIRKHSYYPSEEEVLIPAATQFRVKGRLKQGNDLHIIQLEEIQPPFPLLQPVSKMRPNFYPQNTTHSTTLFSSSSTLNQNT